MGTRTRVMIICFAGAVIALLTMGFVIEHLKTPSPVRDSVVNNTGLIINATPTSAVVSVSYDKLQLIAVATSTPEYRVGYQDLPPASTAWTTYNDPVNGFSFDYPVSWKVYLSDITDDSIRTSGLSGEDGIIPMSIVVAPPNSVIDPNQPGVKSIVGYGFSIYDKYRYSLFSHNTMDGLIPEEIAKLNKGYCIRKIDQSNYASTIYKAAAGYYYCGSNMIRGFSYLCKINDYAKCAEMTSIFQHFIDSVKFTS